MTGKMEHHEVSIAGETFYILSDEGKNSVNKLVGYVDTIMREISEKSKNSDMKRIAILTAVELAHKLKNLELDVAQKDKKESKLVDIIDKELLSIIP